MRKETLTSDNDNCLPSPNGQCGVYLQYTHPACCERVLRSYGGNSAAAVAEPVICSSGVYTVQVARRAGADLGPNSLSLDVCDQNQGIHALALAHLSHASSFPLVLH